MNKTLSKKIQFIVCISLVVIIICLGVITLIMGIVPTGGLKGKFDLPDEVYIYSELYPSGKLRLRKGEGAGNRIETERINEIYDRLDSGLKQKSLTALFRGELGSGFKYYNTAGVMDKCGNDEENNITIMFIYTDSLNRLADENDITSNYKYVCFTVSNTTKWHEVTFGMGVNNNDSDDVASNQYYYTRCYTRNMNTSSLYKYVYSLIEGQIDR